MGPFISNRAEAYNYPTQGPAEFVFLDEHEFRPEELTTHAALVANRSLVPVAMQGSFILYRYNTQ
jgi:hypothetical protein